MFGMKIELISSKEIEVDHGLVKMIQALLNMNRC